MPIIHSLLIAFSATLTTFLIALPVAYYLLRRRTHFGWLLESLLLLPLVLPPTVVGLFLLQLFGKFGLGGRFLALFHNYSLIFTLSGATLATIIVVLPIMYQALKAALQSVDPNLIEAATVMGATPLETLRLVVVPNAYQGLIISLLLTFCRGLGEFGASLMVAGYIEGKTDTIATSIYFSIQGGDTQTALFLSGVNILIGVLALLLIHLLNQQIERRKQPL
ncbi:molybdate ABC transporter permease subunit [Loigolactobacillus zhaoyuanensis]|uniref:Molybdenum transport system permease n=1 Tax=Loigolactobacillus zhaoyuanensis TaxID=2486017 RepID=A0ABW8UCD9_9LACO|nr:molybdate ABC transporter permease subunit [Loigolactobacillus zhaoyuanensis]